LPATRPGRATAGLLGVLLAVAVAGVLVNARSASNEAQRVEQQTARAELTRDVATLRATVAGPTRDAEQTAAALEVVAAESLTGSDREPAQIAADAERLVEELRGHADRLEEAAGHPLPTRPAALPVARADALFARLQPLDDQTMDVVAHLRASADRIETITAAATALQEAATTYAAATGDLPDGDDPDVHARAWREERDRLAAYRQAVDAAAEVEGLDALAAAHAHLVDALDDLAAGALATLGDGDVDAYNDRVAAGIGDDDLADWRGRLQAGADEALASKPLAHIDRSRRLALGLVRELETVRRTTDGVTTTAG